jgi:hypothetical protein
METYPSFHLIVSEIEFAGILFSNTKSLMQWVHLLIDENLSSVIDFHYKNRLDLFVAITIKSVLKRRER